MYSEFAQLHVLPQRRDDRFVQVRQEGHNVLRSKVSHPRGARHDGAQRLVPRIREPTESTAADTPIHGEQQQSVSQQLPGAAIATSCHELSAAAKHKLPGSRTAQQLSAPGAGARATEQLPTAAATKLRSDPTTAAASNPAKLSRPCGGAQQLRSSLFDACLRNANATTDHHHNDNGPHTRLLEIRVRRERNESHVPQNVPRTHFSRAA